MMWANLRRLRPGRGAAVLLIASGAHAQDFPDTQVMANRVLFAAQDAAAERRAAERRRVDDLAQRADQQAALLQAQAASVQRLGDELQNIRDERQLIDLAAAFDAALIAKRWALVRGFLADTVTIDLDGQPEATGTVQPADLFVTSLPTLTAGRVILPRSNQQARIDGEHATLSSDGYAWKTAATSRDLRSGQYEYRFVRAANGWKIDALVFDFTAVR